MNFYSELERKENSDVNEAILMVKQQTTRTMGCTGPGINTKSIPKELSVWEIKTGRG